MLSSAFSHACSARQLAWCPSALLHGIVPTAFDAVPQYLVQAQLEELRP